MSDYNYKCPRCGGEFNVWDHVGLTEAQCPFCGMEKGEYGNKWGSAK